VFYLFQGGVQANVVPSEFKASRYDFVTNFLQQGQVWRCRRLVYVAALSVGEMKQAW